MQQVVQCCWRSVLDAGANRDLARFIILDDRQRLTATM
jgi:hypothetical protein